MTLEQWVNTISNAIVGVSALFAAIFAYKALRTWRDEIRGRDKYTVARHILLLALQLRDEFAYIRSPIFILTIPVSKELEDRGIDPNSARSHGGRERQKAEREFYAVRLQKISSVLSELELAAIEVEAVLNPSIIDELNKLDRKAKELGLGINQSIDAITIPTTEPTTYEYEELQQLLYSSHPSGDRFTAEVQEIIERLKEELKKYL
jgi:hypothetical protein